MRKAAREREWPRIADTETGDTWRGPGAQPHLSQTFCLLFPHPREILGLVDMVTLENGELGPLLSAGTLRGLEDECVTDVKVPRTWPLRVGTDSGGHKGLGRFPSPTSFHFLFPVVT